MPLFHSLACSLQPTAHAQTGGTKTHVHAHMNANTHTLNSRLKAFPPPCLFSSAMTFCPDMSLKSVAGSGGVISPALCIKTGRRDGAEGGWGTMSWCWIMRVNWALGVTDPSLVAWWRQPIESLCSPPVLSFPLLQAPLPCCLSPSHMGRTFELDQELNHISTLMPVCRGTNCWLSD